MLCLQQRLVRVSVPVQQASLPLTTKRYYKKQKMSAQEISEALAKKRAQKKTLLDAYSQKYGTKKQAENENERDKFLAKARRLKRQKEEQEEAEMEGDDVMGIDEWFSSLRENHFSRPEVADALSPQLSYESYTKIIHLHNRDPHYWNPVRLANLFKAPVEYMRGLIFEAKIIEEANLKGVKLYDDIEAGFRQVFPTYDMIEGFEEKGNFDIPVRKIHNPWYFVDPGLKSGELLKFIRARETRYYREASRIPSQKYARMQEFPEVLPQGIAQRKEPHKKAKYFMIDGSSCYNLYTRPILVRDHDNTWRTPTWEERRHVYNWRRPVKKCPLKVPFVYPDNNQPDRIAIQDKPPAAFDIPSSYTDPHDHDENEEEVPTTQDEFGLTEEGDLVEEHKTNYSFKKFGFGSDEFGGATEGEYDGDSAEGENRKPAGRGRRGRNFGLQGKFDLNPKRVAEELNDNEERTDFSNKYRVKFDYGNTWKDPTVF